MPAWTNEELTRIGTATELQIARADATAPCATRGPSGSSAWATTSMSARCTGAPAAGSPAPEVRHEGQIRAGGVDKDVTFADTDPDLNDQIDVAYGDKYHRYGERIVGGVVNPRARAATSKLVPR